MNDRERLLDWFDSGRLVRPPVDEPSIPHVARAMARLCGVDIPTDPATNTITDLIGAADHYVLILADGFGMNILGSVPGASFLREHVAAPISTTFPSSTAPALTSLISGAWPAEHGALGWFLYLAKRDIPAIPLPFTERFGDESLSGSGVSPREVFDWDPLIGRYDRDVRVVLPALYEGSVYTTQISGGRDVVGYEGFDTAIDGLIRQLEGASGRSFTYLYTAGVDHPAHEDGIGSPAVREAVETLDAGVHRLAQALGPSVRIVLTADHGLQDVPDPKKMLLEADDPILDLVRTPPSGEPRAPLFHVRPGRQEEFAGRFRERWGESFVLLTAEEVEELRLLGPGPLSPIARSRLGDFMAIAGDGEVLLFVPDEIDDLRGFHGGLTAEEMFVPVIVA